MEGIKGGRGKEEEGGAVVGVKLINSCSNFKTEISQNEFISTLFSSDYLVT